MSKNVIFLLSFLIQSSLFGFLIFGAMCLDEVFLFKSIANLPIHSDRGTWLLGPQGEGC